MGSEVEVLEYSVVATSTKWRGEGVYIPTTHERSSTWLRKRFPTSTTSGRLCLPTKQEFAQLQVRANGATIIGRAKLQVLHPHCTAPAWSAEPRPPPPRPDAHVRTYRNGRGE